MNGNENKKAVLVVYNNPDFAGSLKEILEDNGHEVDLAFSGEEAAALFDQGDYRTTFMDMKLSEMDGIESFLNIREKNTPAGATGRTGYQVERLVSRALDNGSMKVLRIPFDLKDALALVEEDQPADFILIEE